MHTQASARSVEPYTYEPLITPDTVRLLVLEAGEGRNPLKCSFKDHQILDNHEAAMFKNYRGSAADYTAISYTWHAQTGGEDDSVFCDEKPIRITRNLADLLYRIREKYNKELWIDQLCIDQDSKKEKEQQILFMRHIYQQSREVVFWIGEEDTRTPTAFELIKKLDELVLFLRVDPENPESPVPGTIEVNQHMAELGIPALDSNEWWPLMELLQRPIFQRLWIVQEVVLGSRVTVRCGSHTLDFDALGRAATFLTMTRWNVKLREYYVASHREQYFPPDSTIEHYVSLDVGRVDFLLSLYNRRAKFQEGSTESLEQLLLSTRRCKTSRDFRHDKVYALLGLLDPSTPSRQIPSALLPSYAKTAEEVFRDTTKYLIENGSLDILSGVEDMSLRSPDLALPSWVPNFDVFQSATILGMPSHTTLTPFAAGGPQATQNPPTWKVGEPDVLQLEACKIDDVLLIGPDYASQSDYAFLEGSAKFVDLFQPYPTGEYIVDAFWRTLVANNDMLAQYPADESLYREFVEFCLQAAVNLRRDHELNKLKEEGLIPAPEGVDSSAILTERLGAVGGDYVRFILFVGAGARVIPSAPSAMKEWARGLYNVFTVGLSRGIPTDYLQNSDASRYRSALQHWCYFRRCFTTSSQGYIGIGPRSLQHGDGVFVLRGGRVPFALRKIAENKYIIVGECYVHGIMHGEALQGNNFEWIQIR
jgi:Heterokaryon incompatibility protein (HET)